jgi:hypothetical protein
MDAVTVERVVAAATALIEGQRAEGKGQKTEDKGQRTESTGQKA